MAKLSIAHGSHCLEVFEPEMVNVEIRADGKVLWVCCEDGTVLRVGAIKNLTITDHRKDSEDE